MILSKELLTHIQWYFTREAQRNENWTYESDLRNYNLCLQYLEEVRIALKEYESNPKLP